jgi:hypothetical protein
MDRSNVCTLIGETYTQDSIGQMVPAEVLSDVFCNVASVSQSEWFAGGQNGLKPELKLTMFAPDYTGQKIVEVNGNRYTIYRTYVRQDELLELYLERKTGT